MVISTAYQTNLGFNFQAKTCVNTFYLNYLRKEILSEVIKTPVRSYS